MAIEYTNSTATFKESISVEEADGLLEWMIKNPKGKLDLTHCQHLHAANLQVLLVAKMPIVALPDDQGLRTWLNAATEASLTDVKKTTVERSA
jgi:hypothetical protein